MNLDQIIRRDGAKLSEALGLDANEARIEVQCLLQAVLNVNRAYLMTYPELVLGADELLRYRELLGRRLRGEPVAYLLGEREFFGHAFKVTKDTLIPRPDTELLVELALQRIANQPVRRVLDMGTGSGAIAISIAHEKPDIEVFALDASNAALEVAAENADALGVCNLHFLHSDWYAAIGGERFDLIISNPPYIAANDPHLEDLGYEPGGALVSGVDGLDDIRRIIADSMNHLNPGGWLMIEHGYDQAVRVRDLLRQSGFAEVSTACDLSGVERVSMGRA